MNSRERLIQKIISICKQLSCGRSFSICLLALILCPSISIGTSINAVAGDAGTGFFVTRDGYFVTNHRTVLNAGSNTITIRDKFGKQFAAVVVAADAANDLVLLKANGSFVAVPIAKSSTVEIGDRVFASVPSNRMSRSPGTGLIKATVSSLTGLRGAPNVFGISISSTSGGIGGTGGPLLTSDGNVIGVMTAPRRSKVVLAANKGRMESTAFAIKSDYLLALLATNKSAWSQLQPPSVAISRTHGQVAKYIGRAVGMVVAVEVNKSSAPVAKREVNKIAAAEAPTEKVHSDTSNSDTYLSDASPSRVAATKTTSSVEEMYQTGHKALSQQDYPVAYHWISQAAEQGHAKAQAALANMYLNGQGVDRDALAASIWFRKAALQGDNLAGENLGILFRDGLGVEQDDIEAAWWFNRSAKRGIPSAQANLGLMYEEGRGVSQDDAEAVQWFRRAAERGNALAQYRLGIHYVEGRGVVKDNAEASKWLTKSARQGFAQAQDYLRAGGVAQ